MNANSTRFAHASQGPRMSDPAARTGRGGSPTATATQPSRRSVSTTPPGAWTRPSTTSASTWPGRPARTSSCRPCSATSHRRTATWWRGRSWRVRRRSRARRTAGRRGRPVAGVPSAPLGPLPFLVILLVVLLHAPWLLLVTWSPGGAPVGQAALTSGPPPRRAAAAGPRGAAPRSRVVRPRRAPRGERPLGRVQRLGQRHPAAGEVADRLGDDADRVALHGHEVLVDRVAVAGHHERRRPEQVEHEVERQRPLHRVGVGAVAGHAVAVARLLDQVAREQHVRVVHARHHVAAGVPAARVHQLDRAVAEVDHAHRGERGVGWHDVGRVHVGTRGSSSGSGARWVRGHGGQPRGGLLVRDQRHVGVRRPEHAVAVGVVEVLVGVDHGHRRRPAPGGAARRGPSARPCRRRGCRRRAARATRRRRSR